MYFHEKIFETADAIVTPMTGYDACCDCCAFHHI
jgi:hypothetical protein